MAPFIPAVLLMGYPVGNTVFNLKFSATSLFHLFSRNEIGCFAECRVPVADVGLMYRTKYPYTHHTG